MATNCPNARATRTWTDADGALHAQHQCALAERATGIPCQWITDELAGACAGDDGTSACSMAINDLLADRLVAHWESPDPIGGCGGTLSLPQALGLIIQRQGSAAAEQVLLQAIQVGMPLAQAQALALAQGLALD